MKNFTIAASAVLVLLTPLVSCNNYNELPPLNEGYATEFILPDPVPLTTEDREYLQALEDEYEQATKAPASN